MKSAMKRILVVLMTLALLASFAACGKETVDPVDDEELRQIPTAAETGKETTPAPIETTTEETPMLANGETDMLSYTKYDAKTGTLTISGIEEFSLPRGYDVSAIKQIVLSADVLSADLEPGEFEYSGLEIIQCSPNCDVSVSTSDIIQTPFYQNSANWADGVLYIGSRLAAINKDAAAVCKLSSNISSIDWDLREDVFETAPQIERFEIAEGNKTYHTDNDGVLYIKTDDSLEIALCPPASPMETYNLPDEVHTLPFPLPEKLKTIRISAKSNLNDIQFGKLGTSALSAYRVDDGHPSLYAKDGVLFSKETEDGSVRRYILDYPAGKSSKEYRIPDGTDAVQYGAFQNCGNLETLYVPASVKDWGNGDGFFSAFFGCKKLTHVYVDKANENYSSTKDGLLLIPFEWQEMDGKVTKRTRMIYLPGRTDKHFIIPSAITDFEAYGNTYLETIDLGKDVRSFSVSVDACPKLKAFRAEGNQNGYYTKDGVLYLKTQNWEEPKKEDTYLIYYPAGKNDKKFTVPDGVTHLYGAIEWSSDSAFHNNPYIEEIILPDSVTFIGIGAFAGCTALKKVNLPDTLKNLGDDAFYGCAALKELTIPTSLEALGFYDGISSYALSGSSITDIEYKGTKAQWDALVNAAYGATLPAGVRVHCTDA